MAASPLVILAESGRQLGQQDANFLKKLLYFFELRVPSGLAGSSFIFPLVLGPNSYSMSEPFTVDKTPTQGGGLYVEENGIIMRTIRLKGHTGFKPRKLPPESTGAQALAINLSDNVRSFGRILPFGTTDAISGQRHFQYLQDAVFRLYGDLKRDPSTARETKLLFHNPKDSEQWIVVPENFNLNRSADKRVLYEYDIELTAVAKGDGADVTFSEDKSLFDQIKDGISEVKSAVDSISGFINDITATVGELRGLVSDVDKVLDGITNIVTAVDNFVTGATDLIEAPAALILSVGTGIDRVSDTLVNTVSGVQNIPSAYTNAWNNVGSAIDRIGQFPELFETDAQKTLRKIQESQQIAQSTIDSALEATAPSTIAGFDSIGTAPLPGTADRALAIRTAGRGINAYTAAKSRQVAQGDTLARLASQFLGDARLWKDIAILNGLKPPYLDAIGGANIGGPDNPLPGVLGIGNTILIPNFGTSPKKLPVLPILGVAQTEPFEVQLLGRDFLLEEDDRLFDWVVDEDHGSDDFKTVEGVPNLAQGLTIRLSVERGDNPLYRFIGFSRMIGLNNVDVDQQTARFRITETLTNDPRISQVRRLVTTPSGDNLEVDADVEVRGFSQGLAVRAIGVI